MDNIVHQKLIPNCQELIRKKKNRTPWKYRIRPIAWWNFPWWIQHTVSQDKRFYRHQPKRISASPLYHWVSPNLSQPIFIFGAPRSGTTFLGESLSVLPELSYHFEPVLTKAAVRYVYTRQWSRQKAERFYRRVYAWLMRIHQDGDLCFCEKTPRNSFILPFLYETFPDARFVHIIRDGRDAALSLSREPWYRNDMKGAGDRDPSGYPFGPLARFWVTPERIREFETTSDLHRCIWLWRRYVESAKEGSLQIPASQYYELNYERLVQDPISEATKLLNFLKIETESSRQAFIDTLKSQARQDSIGSWKASLTTQVLTQMYAEAGKCLNRCGYDGREKTINKNPMLR